MICQKRFPTTHFLLIINHDRSFAQTSIMSEFGNTGNPILALRPYTSRVTYTELDSPAFTTVKLRQALHAQARKLLIHLETYSHRLGHRDVPVFGATPGNRGNRCTFPVADENDGEAAEYSAKWTPFFVPQEASSGLSDNVLRVLLVQLCADTREVHLWDERHGSHERRSLEEREARRPRRGAERSRQNSVVVGFHRSMMPLSIRLRGAEDELQPLMSAARRREQREQEILQRREMRLPFRPHETPSP